MPEIGIRELKSRASEIVRAVREERAEYVITHRGEPVAMIVPLVQARERKPTRSLQEFWAEVDDIAREIDKETGGTSILEQLFKDREES